MPTVLRDNQHELMSSDGSLSLVFGTEDTGYLTTTHPAIEYGDDRNGDVDRVREDGVSFGEDFTGGKNVTFEIGVLTDRANDPHTAGADALAELEWVWKNQRLRDRSTKYAVLRSMMVPGRVRRAYGRPRRYTETTGQLTRRGYSEVVCDFKVGDGRWYDDEAQSVSASLIPPTDGGLIAPLVTPLTTTVASQGPASLVVGGKASTWPVVTFYGPVTNPTLQIGAMTIGLNDTIPDGMTVTVDPRPWVRQVTRSDGATKAGRLTYDTPPMRKCLLEPGSYEAIYSGTDQTGTSWCQIEWRNAWPRW